jgi:nitroreductase/NAD-dependent dihydropyrimidine dehydrogenase PreA subunit
MALQTIDAALCTRCGLCTHICANRTFVAGEGAIHVDGAAAALCIRCGQCMAACPKQALRVEGLDPLEFLPLPREVASASALQALMTRRRSIRAYTDQPVPRGLLQRLVDAAALAPMGFPPSEVGVTVLSTRAQVADVVAPCARQMQQLLKASRSAVGRIVMRRVVGAKTWRMLERFLIPMIPTALEAYGADGFDFVAYGAPALLVFHVSPEASAGETDVTLAATYAMLMAEALGLGSIMLGLGAAAFMDKGLKARYGIPAENQVLNTLAVGYAKYHYVRSIPRKLGSVSWPGQDGPPT